MADKIKLKPCPFCGKSESVHLLAHGTGIKRFFIVRCECGLGGCGANVTGATRRFAADNWNRRHGEKVEQAMCKLDPSLDCVDCGMCKREGGAR